MVLCGLCAAGIFAPVKNKQTSKQNAQAMLKALLHTPKDIRNAAEVLKPDMEFILPFGKVPRTLREFILPFGKVLRTSGEFILPFGKVSRTSVEFILPFVKVSRTFKEFILPFVEIPHTLVELILPFGGFCDMLLCVQPIPLPVFFNRLLFIHYKN